MVCTAGSRTEKGKSVPSVDVAGAPVNKAAQDLLVYPPWFQFSSCLKPDLGDSLKLACQCTFGILLTPEFRKFPKLACQCNLEVLLPPVSQDLQSLAVRLWQSALRSPTKQSVPAAQQLAGAFPCVMFVPLHMRNTQCPCCRTAVDGLLS